MPTTRAVTVDEDEPLELLEAVSGAAVAVAARVVTDTLAGRPTTPSVEIATTVTLYLKDRKSSARAIQLISIIYVVAGLKSLNCAVKVSDASVPSRDLSTCTYGSENTCATRISLTRVDPVVGASRSISYITAWMAQMTYQ